MTDVFTGVERWERIKELLYQAMQLAPQERRRFLDEACGPDASLRTELESLLSAEADVRSGFLQPPRIIESSAHPDENGLADGLGPGKVFAERFNLIRKLGEGGMGQVWLAEQTSPVRRQVAVKLIKAGMYDETVVQRFKSERQSLAIMDHPAIAKVLDAGATLQGQPYFVMEYVPGLPITEYCDRHMLDIRGRLELFIQACEGVQHAHLKAVIHRDLKPANVLVVEVDGKPVPRIIDFGLAKATAREQAEKTLFTRYGLFFGTPGYVSPEQADPDVQDVDTRTDVYSLGVVLYVLLTGMQPFQTKRQSPPFDELLRKLREDEPPPPSAKIGADRDISTAAAAKRGTLPAQLVRQLRGDLDWITMKAVERDRERRYSSPAELAADLRRYLNHEPTTARPASASYRLRKYARRHRVAVSVAAGSLVLLAVFAVLQSLQLRQTIQERDRANRELDRAARIADFMTSMFKVADPSEARGNSVTAREILDKAALQIESGLQQDPALQARLMYTMGNVYRELALDRQALSLLENAARLQRNVLGLQNRETLQSMTSVGRTLRYLGKYTDAEKINRETLATQTQLLGAGDPDTLESMDNLADTLYREGNFSDAESWQRRTLAARRRVQGVEHPAALATMSTLGASLRSQGKYAEAEILQRQVVDIQRRVLGADHPNTAKSINSLANTLYNEGKMADAEAMYREALDLDRRVLGADHSATVNVQANLANVLRDEGRLTEAETVLRQAVEIRRRVQGESNPATLLVMENLGLTLDDEGRQGEAEKLLRQTLQLRRQVLGPDHPDTVRTTYILAETLRLERRYAEAEDLARAALEAERRALGADHPGTLTAVNILANTLRGEGRYAEAEKAHRGALDTARRILKPDHPDILEIESSLALDLSQEKRYEEAKPLFMDAVHNADLTNERNLSSSAWYQFACGAAVTGHREEALQDLRNAVDRGYQDVGSLMAESDLKSLRSDPQFLELLAALKKQFPPTRT
jgi:eukaryotic-like serine/threonine-protein kinase